MGVAIRAVQGWGFIHSHCITFGKVEDSFVAQQAILLDHFDIISFMTYVRTSITTKLSHKNHSQGRSNALANLIACTIHSEVLFA